MGRPTRRGLDYFPLDTAWETSMRLVKARYGLKGIGFMIELYSSIYGSGYYRKWDEENELLFADECRETVEWVREIIEYVFKQRLLDEVIFREKGVLTSHGIQARYFKIVSGLKRESIEIIDGITYPEFAEKVFPGGNPSFPGGNPSFPGGNPSFPQGKVHKAKPKEIELKEQHAREAALVDNLPAAAELTQSLKTVGLNFTPADLTSLGARFASLGLAQPDQLAFVQFCAKKARDKPKIKNVPALIKAGLLEYDDWFSEFKAQAKPSKARPWALPAPACSCGSDLKANRDQGIAICPDCKSEWTYDWVFEQWTKDKTA